MVNIKLQTDNSGRLRGFGYVEFETRQMLIDSLAFNDLVSAPHISLIIYHCLTVSILIPLLLSFSKSKTDPSELILPLKIKVRKSFLNISLPTFGLRDLKILFMRTNNTERQFFSLIQEENAREEMTSTERTKVTTGPPMIGGERMTGHLLIGHSEEVRVRIQRWNV